MAEQEKAEANGDRKEEVKSCADAETPTTEKTSKKPKDADNNDEGKATLNIDAHGFVCEYLIVPFNTSEEDCKIELDDVLEAFKNGDGGKLWNIITELSEESIDLTCLWEDGEKAFEWKLEAEEGSEISSGTHTCYLKDVLKEDDKEEDVSYTDNDYVLMSYDYVKGTQASFEVPADIDMDKIKFIPNKLMPGKFKKDAKYYNAFGKKTYILIKYNAKKKQWEVIRYMRA